MPQRHSDGEISDSEQTSDPIARPRLEQAYNDRQEPKVPAPTYGFGDETAVDRSNDRSEKRPNGEDGHCSSPILLWDDVCDSTASVSKRSRASTACHQAEEEKNADISAEGAADQEGHEDQIIGVVDIQASIKLRQRSNKYRAEGSRG